MLLLVFLYGFVLDKSHKQNILSSDSPPTIPHQRWLHFHPFRVNDDTVNSPFC